MKKLYFIIALLLSASLTASARDSYRGTITLQRTNVEKSDENVRLDATVDLSSMRLRSQNMIQLTPVLRSLTGTESLEFAPIVVSGGKRYRMLKRELRFGDFTFSREPQTILRRRNNRPQAVRFGADVPFRSWMRNSELVFEQKASGCANCRLLTSYSKPLAMAVSFPEPFVPQFNIVYVTPPVEDPKQRSETYSAYLNYEIGRFALLPNFKNNAAVLAEVDQIISRLRSDKDLTVTQFRVNGYASPDGNYNSNQILSENRARTFVNYVRDHHNWDTRQINQQGMGEDWPGLRIAVDKSSIQDRAQVISIIDEVYDIDQRKARIKSLSGGETYRNLLINYFPPLRRNDYTISYVARAFDVQEAREIIRTKPNYLSINEMYYVALTYPKDSREFKEVFDVAVHLHPNDTFAILNSAALDIENGDLDRGVERLRGIDHPAAWNNIGYAYIRKGDTAQAAEYFKRAADAGCPEGADNLEQLNRWLEEK